MSVGCYMRLRIQFEKLGSARFMSHKDIVRAFQRCLASCDIPVSFSEGFHPHMRMSFGPPLRTGWNGIQEYMDIFVDRPPGEIAGTCNAILPEGLRITSVSAVAERTPKLASDMRAAAMVVRLSRTDAEKAIGDLEDFSVTMRSRFGGTDKDPRIVDVDVRDDGDTLEFCYTSTMLSGKIVRPDDIVAAMIGDPGELTVPLRVTRTAQFVERDGEYRSPVDKGVLQNRP